VSDLQPPELQRQQTNTWSPGQRILNGLGARQPEHTFNQPVPITARIMWEETGEEFIDTVALGWTSRDVCVRMPDTRYRLTSVWLDAADVSGADLASGVRSTGRAAACVEVGKHPTA
jgi:hypothetical protein